MIRRLALCLALPTVLAVAATAAPAFAEREPDLQPPTVTPADIKFQHRTLRDGEPREVGLLPEYVERMRTDAESYLVPTPDHPRWPTYAGAVVLAAKDGVVVQRAAVGMAVRYSAVGPAPARIGVELPADQQIPARPDTIYDLASISKLFTTIVVMQQVERGRIDLDAPVATYLPDFAQGGKSAVTVRHLLTHTSGLPAFLPLWSTYPTPETRLQAAITTPITAVPGTRYVYSDLGLIALGALVQRVTGQRLDVAVRASVTGPLGMADTGYNPDPSLLPRIAATEDETYAGRGMVWGQVHDENAWALGGVAGHAGVFSTADDLAVLCQMMLNGGEYGGVRILAEETVRAMLVNYNAHLENQYPESDRGLGFELNKHWYMEGLSSPVAFGHTGFTGTTVVVDPLAHSFVILLSNRVHPDRNWGSNNVARRAVARDMANALPVQPIAGGEAWRADRRDPGNVTLTVPLRAAAPAGSHVSFLLWYDTEPRYDVLRVEVSTGNGQWSLVPLTLLANTGRWASDGALTGYGGRQWWKVTAELPTGTTQVRWRYTTDSTAQGRGVYVDHVTALAPGEVLFHGEAGDRDAFQPDGWSLATT